MSRVDFMSKLNALLQDVSVEERNEAMQYYNDYFDDAGLENEMQVIAELDSPEKVAAKIKAGLGGEDDNRSEYSEMGYTDTRFESKDPLAPRHSVEEKDEPPRTNNVIKILLIVAIVLVGGPIIIPVMIGVLGTIFALIFGVAALFIGLIITAIAIFVFGLILFGLGIAKLFVSLPVGCLMMGCGMILGVLGLLSAIGMVKLTLIVFKAVFRGMVWICRKPFGRKVVS